MGITYDAAKDALNIAKHGVSLALARELEWEVLYAKADERADYGELRMIGYAPLRDRLYCVVFVDRGAAGKVMSRRIISLRKANSREVKYYVSIQT